MKEKEYGTFQFVRASYSLSRSTLILITNRPTFLALTTKISGLFDRKQEYTDIWVLGITYFDTSKTSDFDKEIISTFFQKIIKYRSDNNLPPYTLQQLEASSKYLLKKEDICKFISCKKST